MFSFKHVQPCETTHIDKEHCILVSPLDRDNVIPANARRWAGLMFVHHLRRRPNRKITLVQVLVFDGMWTPSNIWCWANVGLMLGQRLRRCPNIKPTLVVVLSSACSHKRTWLSCVFMLTSACFWRLSLIPAIRVYIPHCPGRRTTLHTHNSEYL